jgi:hypothetical protein
VSGIAHLLALALTAAGADASDDPMIRWDCDRQGGTIALEMVRPPLAEVAEREVLMFSGIDNFEQCHLDVASWTLLVDIVEYEEGPCAQFPDTIVSLMRGQELVLSRVLVSPNCHKQPVLAAARIVEPGNGDPPRIELCAAGEYGGVSRCAPLGARQPVDNRGIARRANGGQ